MAWEHSHGIFPMRYELAALWVASVGSTAPDARAWSLRLVPAGEDRRPISIAKGQPLAIGPRAVDPGVEADRGRYSPPLGLGALAPPTTWAGGPQGQWAS